MLLRALAAAATRHVPRLALQVARSGFGAIGGPAQVPRGGDTFAELPRIKNLRGRMRHVNNIYVWLYIKRPQERAEAARHLFDNII